MEQTTVGAMRKLAEDILEQLDGYEDDEKIKLVGNTYFLNGARRFIGISGFDGGYIAVDRISDSVVTGD